MLALAVVLGVETEIAGVQISYAQQGPDHGVADIIRAGKLRVGLGLGPPEMATRDPVSNEVRGPAVDIARALAARLGVELVLVEYPNVSRVLEGLKDGAWDAGFLGVDPVRTANADFSPSYLQIDLTYLVPAGSSIRNANDVDQPGVRIAVTRGGIEDLLQSRVLQRAEMVRVESRAAAVDLLHAGHAETRAAPRPVLLSESARLPGSRVLEDRFGVVLHAMVVPKGHAGRLAYVSNFIEEAKVSGLVQSAIERAGLRGVQVAPVGNPNAR